MSYTIDELDIEIAAQASKANKTIDNLADKIELLSIALGEIENGSGAKLIELANGLSLLSDSMAKFQSIHKTDFNAIRNGFNAIGQIDSNALKNASQSLQELSNSFQNLNGTGINPDTLARLSELTTTLQGMGRKNVTTAIANMPQLSNALMQMFTTLSTAPQVSQNVIDLVNAMANLAATGSHLGSASRSLSNAFNRIGNSSDYANKRVKSLASTIGLFYAKWFMVIRGIKGLWNASKSAMDYIETLNYFTVALKKVGATSGKESGEAFLESFSDTLNGLNKKLTGYYLDDEGVLALTDSKSLGLNIEQMMNYQAKILGITNSVGMLGEQSVQTAQALSMLAGDLSSLTNRDLADVMNDLTSGLIGMSKTVYKYGIDITATSLQEKAFALGIEKSVSEMTQAEKMQLRLITILDSSKVAWGDQARTLDSVANQYRIFQQQLSNLGRTLGSIFLPVVENVLPYVNGLVIALNKLFTQLGFNLYGNNWLKDLQEGVGDADFSMLEEGLEDANDAAKELHKNLQKFDELNIIDSKSSSSASDLINGNQTLNNALAVSVEEYQKMWNQAFENAKSKANEYADVISNALSNFSIGDMASKFTSAINEGIENVDWYVLGEKLGKLIKDHYNPDDVSEWFKKAFELADTTLIGVVKFSFGLTSGSSDLSDEDKSTLEKYKDNVVKFLEEYDPTNPLGWLASDETKQSIADAWNEDLEYLRRLFKGFAFNPEDGEKFWRTFNESMDKFDEWWDDNVSVWFTAQKWKELFTGNNGAIVGVAQGWDRMIQWWKTSGIGKFFTKYVEPYFKMSDWVTLFTGNTMANAGLKLGWSIFESWWKNTAIYKWYEKNVKSWFTIDKWTFGGVESGLVKTFTDAIAKIKTVWNEFIKGLKLPDFIEDRITFSPPTSTIKGYGGKFATGGFPEDGLFYANHNELVGQFSNGKTAVANNQQITEGIYRAVRQALAEGGIGSNVNVTLEGDAKGLFKVVQKEANNYTRRTGNVVFA